MTIERSSERKNEKSRLPSIDALLRDERIKELIKTAGTESVTAIARDQVQKIRKELGSDPATISASDLKAESIRRILHSSAAKTRWATRRVINATGVVLHTNLGRAPLSDNARNAVKSNAAGYCSVEFSLETGSRGHRGLYAETLLAEVTGAECALVVNNCAAAALLVLSAFGSGGEAILSRGELVEIGGDFRIPDVLEQSGTKLREVGATNRTKIRDYENAITAETRLIVRVHPSNYRIVGFTASVPTASLATLSHKHGLIMYEDAGSGALMDLSAFGLGSEPVISRSIRDGADLVSFSGDKLLGGPQCGLIAGRGELIDKLRKHPLYRALRVGKMTYAALEETLLSYLRGTAVEDIPVLRMLSTNYDELKDRCEAFVRRFRDNISIRLEIIDGESVVGGGSAPDIHPRSPLIAVSHSSLTADRLENLLRNADIPVIARIVRERVLLDLRTMTMNEEDEMAAAISRFSAKTPT